MGLSKYQNPHVCVIPTPCAQAYDIGAPVGFSRIEVVKTKDEVAPPQTADPSPAALADAAPAPSSDASPAVDVATEPEVVKRFCRPRVMPVRLPAPLGPKLFILGEPVLHRYYTVYDASTRSVGFALANNRRNTMDPASIVDRRGALPKDVDMLLMQNTVTLSQVQREARITDDARGVPAGGDAGDGPMLVYWCVRGGGGGGNGGQLRGNSCEGRSRGSETRAQTPKRGSPQIGLEPVSPGSDLEGNYCRRHQLIPKFSFADVRLRSELSETHAGQISGSTHRTSGPFIRHPPEGPNRAGPPDVPEGGIVCRGVDR